jgi:hypothetical protein
MAKLVERLTRQLASSGRSNAKGMAIGLLKKRGHMDDSGNLTEEGKKRQALGNAGRAKDRAAKYGGGKPSDYTYNPKTNGTRKKK